jgi:hypothetical protein
MYKDNILCAHVCVCARVCACAHMHMCMYVCIFAYRSRTDNPICTILGVLILYSLKSERDFTKVNAPKIVLSMCRQLL